MRHHDSGHRLVFEIKELNYCTDWPVAGGLEGLSAFAPRIRLGCRATIRRRFRRGERFELEFNRTAARIPPPAKRTQCQRRERGWGHGRELDPMAAGPRRDGISPGTRRSPPPRTAWRSRSLHGHRPSFASGFVRVLLLASLRAGFAHGGTRWLYAPASNPDPDGPPPRDCPRERGRMGQSAETVCST